MTCRAWAGPRCAGDAATAWNRCPHGYARAIAFVPGPPVPGDLNFVPRVFGKFGNGVSGSDYSRRVVYVDVECSGAAKGGSR